MREDIGRMANQIATQFRHLPAGEAAEAVAAHLRGFWAPAMRADLLAGVEADVQGLDPVVRAAAARLR